MKKSVLSLLAIATMVATMSSCSQDNGGSSNDLNLPTEQSQTESKAESQTNKEKNYYAVKVAFSSTMFQMGTYTLTVQDGDKTEDYVINTAAKETSIVAKNVNTNKTTTDNGRTSVTMVSQTYTVKGFEFKTGFTSTSKTVKFSLSFQPNENFQTPDKDKVKLVYDIQFQNVASESDVVWESGKCFLCPTTDLFTTVPQVIADSSKTFTK